MEIVVVGRHTEIADRFREHATEKLAKVQQLSPDVRRVEVEVTHERNAKQTPTREKVELTVRAKGPVIRAEAAADDRYGALDLALDKLQERLRRAADKRKTRYRAVVQDKTPVADIADIEKALADDKNAAEKAESVSGEVVETQLGDSPVVIRQKLHAGELKSIDNAIDEMELVGHDFFLFIDAETKRPSVAYRRQGWTYGVISLETECEVTE